MSNNASIVSDLTLALLYLTSWEEGSGEYALRRSWKGYDFDILNELNEHDFIAGKRSNKSVYLTEEGIAKAQEVIAGLKNGTLESLNEL